MAFKLNLGLHKNQLTVYKDPHRFKVVAKGRQWGGSTFAQRAAAGISLTKSDQMGMIIAPFANQAYADFKAILEFIKKYEKGSGQKKIDSVSTRWLTITLKNGSEIMMRSGESLTAIRGYTLDWVLMDEAAFCDEEVWKVVEPELGVKKGIGWFISSPNGRNWFFDLYNRSENMGGKDTEFHSFHFTTYDNPYYPKKDIERTKENIPELDFLQEYMAEFIEGGLVFRHLERMMSAPGIQPPIKGRDYVMGVDLAKENDFNVIDIADTATNTQVYTKRDNHLDWSYQKTSIYMEAKRYNNATVIVDKTGVGSAIVEDLQKMDCAYEGAPKQGHLNIVPLVFSGVSKPLLYQHYILLHDNNMIWLLKDPIAKREHERFEKNRTPSGNYTYSAPKKQNDDTVTASALMAWGLEKICNNGLAGPFSDEEIGRKPRKPIDPTNQIDVDLLIQKMESKQVAGFIDDEDQNILPDYGQESK